MDQCTVDNIVYVIDSGLGREKIYDTSTGFDVIINTSIISKPFE
jgi:HrpA-like RNA helicase